MVRDLSSIHKIRGSNLVTADLPKNRKTRESMSKDFVKKNYLSNRWIYTKWTLIQQINKWKHWKTALTQILMIGLTETTKVYDFKI